MTITNEHLEFLDDLRESGVTNMFGASVYLVQEFGLSKAEAREFLGEWMRTFAERQREEIAKEDASVERAVNEAVPMTREEAHREWLHNLDISTGHGPTNPYKQKEELDNGACIGHRANCDCMTCVDARDRYLMANTPDNPSDLDGCPRNLSGTDICPCPDCH